MGLRVTRRPINSQFDWLESGRTVSPIRVKSVIPEIRWIVGTPKPAVLRTNYVGVVRTGTFVRGHSVREILDAEYTAITFSKAPSINASSSHFIAPAYPWFIYQYSSPTVISKSDACLVNSIPNNTTISVVFYRRTSCMIMIIIIVICKVQG